MNYNGEFVTSQLQSDYTFGSYGEKVILVTATDPTGLRCRTSQEFFLENLNIDPLANYNYTINHDTKEVQFDGSPSTLEGSLVVEYNWDFNNDGIVDLTSQEPNANYTYPNFGDYSATLVVKDSQDRTSLVSKNFTIVQMPVPDPGADGKLTLEGIDSDGDGIRDDVQRSIASMEVSSVVKKNLTTYAALSQEMLNYEFEPTLAIENIRKQIQVQGCVLKNSDIDQNLTGELSATVFNTKERLLTYIRTIQHFNGQSVSGDELECL